LKRTVVVSCAAVFLLVTAVGVEMTWGLPASGLGSYSDRTATERRRPRPQSESRAGHPATALVPPAL